MMAVYDFEQWQKDQINNAPASTLILCPDCNGARFITDECDCCGHEKERDCNECTDYEGKVLWGDLSDSKKKETLSAQRYQDVLIDDLSSLANWQGKNKFELLIEYGFTAYTIISSKLERIVKNDDASLQYINKGYRLG